MSGRNWAPGRGADPGESAHDSSASATSQAAAAKGHMLGLQMTHIYPLTVWGQKSIKVSPGPHSLWRLQGRVLPASPRCWRSLACRRARPTCLRCPLASASGSPLCDPPLLIRTPVTGLRAHPAPVGSHLSYLCKDPISKYGHVWRFWVGRNLAANYSP